MKQFSFLVCLLVIPAVGRADTIAFWRFGEKPAGQAAEVRGPIRDVSGFGNHGRLLGSAKYVRGMGFDGAAIQWNGSGMLEVPDAHVFDFRGDFTIEAMVRTERQGSQYIFIKTALEDLDPLGISFLRTVLAAAIMALACFIFHRGSSRPNTPILLA